MMTRAPLHANALAASNPIPADNVAAGGCVLTLVTVPYCANTGLWTQTSSCQLQNS